MQKGTTITDVYAIYKETCLKLQIANEELENSKRNFQFLNQVNLYKLLFNIYLYIVYLIIIVDVKGIYLFYIYL